MRSRRFRVIFILKIFFISPRSLILKISLKALLNFIILNKLGPVIVRSLTHVFIIILFLFIKMQGSANVN
jgi:hypothetical protein